MKNTIVLLALFLLFLTGCSQTISGDNRRTTDKEGISGKKIVLDELKEDLYIRRNGTYRLTGTLNGSVIIDAGKDDSVELVLDGVNIHGGDFAAIYAISCSQLKINLQAGTENNLDDSGIYTQIDENNVNACVFSKSDLILTGTGGLSIDSQVSGIISKDRLIVNSGNYIIHAVERGIEGKDEITIAGGTLSVISEKDALAATNTEQENKGNVLIQGGNLDISTFGDGIFAENALFISAGQITVRTSRNSENKSNRGLKSGSSINISGGSIDLTCYGDCISSKDSVTISGGIMTLYSDDDAIHADTTLHISGGDLLVLSSDEALQGKHVEVCGGNLELHAQDDGINANDSSDEAYGWGMTSSTDASIIICGGKLHIIAGGDGLDSNGSITIEDGTVAIDGPASSSDAAFDYTTVGVISGGTLFAIGSSEEAVPVSEGSTQVSFILDLGHMFNADTAITVKNGGRILFEHISAKPFSCILFSCPEMKVGDTVELCIQDEVKSLYLDSMIVNDL